MHVTCFSLTVTATSFAAKRLCGSRRPAGDPGHLVFTEFGQPTVGYFALPHGSALNDFSFADLQLGDRGASSSKAPESLDRSNRGLARNEPRPPRHPPATQGQTECRWTLRPACRRAHCIGPAGVGYFALPRGSALNGFSFAASRRFALVGKRSHKLSLALTPI